MPVTCATQFFLANNDNLHGLIFHQPSGVRCQRMKNTAATLTDKKNTERWKSVIALEKFGQPATDYLVAALKDEDQWVRYLAADALANIGAAQAVTQLIALLKDPEQDVRFAAAAALGKIGDQKALSALESTLKNDNAYVRIAAEEAIDKIRPAV